MYFSLYMFGAKLKLTPKGKYRLLREVLFFKYFTINFLQGNCIVLLLKTDSTEEYKVAIMMLTAVPQLQSSLQRQPSALSSSVCIFLDF